MFSLGLTLIGMIFFVFQKRKIQFYIFSLSAFFQFTFGNFRSIPDFLFIEWITPIFFIILVNEMIPLSGPKRREKLIDFRGTEMLIVGIILLIITAAVSFGKNELFGDSALSVRGTNRMYFGIINNILIFFTTVIYLSRYFKELNIPEFIKLLLVTSVSIGILRLAVYFLGFSFPFMSGGFDYNPGTSTRFGGITFRIGGLSEATLVGIAALFANFYIRKKLNIFYAICLLIIQFMSGGRTMLVAIVVAVSIYSTLFLKKIFGYLVMLAMVGIIVIIILMPREVIEGQINRMTSFETGVENQEQIRIPAYIILYNSFQENPIFGKGLSPYGGVIFAINEDAREFIRTIAFGGGHGSYMSILGIFGITGLLFFVIINFGTVILSYKKIRKYFYLNADVCALSTFVFLLAIMGSIYFISSYNGYGIPYIFFNAGLIVSIRMNENLNNINLNE